MISTKPKMIVIVAAFAAFLATFNETFLNVAFTPIMTDLNVGVSTVQWLATAYMLGAAVMVPVSAFMYRRIPTKPLFLFTTSLLIVGSVIGALATSFPILLAGRIVQALGTGMLIPIGMNITLEVAPREKLGTYMGIMGAMTTLGPSLSVIVAGILLSFSNWHLLLWVFAGLSALCFISGAFMLTNVAHLTHPKLDFTSVVLISIALIGILYAVSTIFSGSVTVAIIAAVIGAFLLYLFLKRQKKLSQPLIDLRPLKVKPFSIGVIINMISLVVIFAMNIIIPIYMQSAMGASSLGASLTLFPAIMLSCIIAPIAGKVFDKHGAGVLLPLGFAMICLFTIALAFLHTSGSFVILAVLYIPVICGSALIIGPVQSFSLSYLDYELNPHGVTVMSTGFQIAGCIGSSLFTGVYSAVVASRMAFGSDAFSGASDGFMITGLLAAAFALVGLILALYTRKFNCESEKVEPTGILRSIMKTNVYTVSADATLLDAMRLITEKEVSGVPVIDNVKNIVGFISDGDILRYLAKKHPLFENAYSLAAMSGDGFDKKLLELMNIKVIDVAEKKVITTDANDDLGDVCRILSEYHLKKIPVMEDGRMIGMINSSNITKYAMNACISATAIAK
ncbi:MFS transporter [Caproicibacter fermentans]|uniref:MFS transporter n=1 Tax=Caproicibacter fermentans TaxID=2576756 RepID=A0A7G8T8R9_9FIRM|nr:MFS transporter [Caproicibacter fermentans]QNK40010.1 MFS transporter [Caproicibacter fermentans]